MDLDFFRQTFTEENIKALLEQYRALGPLPGILLPLLEAFFPFLPLFVFVAANALVYGLWLGSFYSWLGASIGAIAVFVIIRRFARQRVVRFIIKYKKVQQMMHWLERRGFGAIFLLYCFPFTPSALVNVVAGLSQMNPISFIIAAVFGKMVTILALSFIGYDLFSAFKNPLQLILITIFIVVLWLGGKFLETKLKEKPYKEKQ